MREIARWADIPLINLQCDVDHPTQTLADLMTLREQRGADLKGLRVAVSWAFAPSYAKPMSVPPGPRDAAARASAWTWWSHIRRAASCMPELRRRAEAAAAASGGSVSFVDDMDEAFEGADVVYPKSWGRLDAFADETTALAESERYKDWICDARRMSLARPDAVYMHCLPADRGHEVTDEVIDGPQSVVYDEAENRMHTGKALLALTMGGYRS